LRCSLTMKSYVVIPLETATQTRHGRSAGVVLICVNVCQGIERRRT
jgi:hypothetical protein